MKTLQLVCLLVIYTALVSPIGAVTKLRSRSALQLLTNTELAAAPITTVVVTPPAPVCVGSVLQTCTVKTGCQTKCVPNNKPLH